MFLSTPVTETVRCAALAAMPGLNEDTETPWIHEGRQVPPIHVLLWKAAALAVQGVYALMPSDGAHPLMVFMAAARDARHIAVFPIAFVPDPENAEELVRSHANAYGITLRDLRPYAPFDRAAGRADEALARVLDQRRQDAERQTQQKG